MQALTTRKIWGAPTPAAPVALALALVGALGLPTLARAAVHTQRFPAALSYDFGVHGSHGFIIYAHGQGKEASIAAEEKFAGASRSQVGYSFHTDTKFDGSTIDLKLPGRAHFTARFVPHKTSKTRPFAPCKGAPTVIEQGSFVGHFSFHGERGYTTLTAHRIAGKVTRTPPLTCRYPTESSRGGKRTVERGGIEGEARGERSLALIARRRDLNLDLIVERSELESGGRTTSGTTAVLSQQQTLHGVTISRIVVIAPAPKSALQYLTSGRGPPAEVTVAPPAPFTGSATFLHEPGGKPTWSGDLAVEMPGLGHMPLTGPKFATRVCEGLCGD